jgi:opacity protein-like surface antigen
MRIYILGALLFSHLLLQSQDNPGKVSFGLRSTISMFNHGENTIGRGIGGQFRVQLLDRLNTEWFADYLPGTLSPNANRRDYHIGWSVMYYLKEHDHFKKSFLPYVLAGHCFDYTRINVRDDVNLNVSYQDPSFRWTSAIQAGLGTHYNITQRFDISLSAQYMMHFGKHLHLEESGNDITIFREDHGGIEGHLLATLSMNYKFGSR